MAGGTQPLGHQIEEMYGSDVWPGQGWTDLPYYRGMWSQCGAVTYSEVQEGCGLLTGCESATTDCKTCMYTTVFVDDLVTAYKYVQQ